MNFPNYDAQTDGETDNRYGQSLTELFQFDSSGFSVYTQFLRGIAEANRVLRFESPLLVSYYNNLLVRRTKLQFRVMLKYHMCIYVILMLEFGLLDPSSDTVLIQRLDFYGVVVLLLYTITHWNWNHTAYNRFSLVLCLFTVVMVFWTRLYVIHQAHGLHSPGILLIVGMFTFLPLQTTICVCVTMVYVLLATSLNILHNWNRIPDLEKKDRNVDIFEFLHLGNRDYYPTAAESVVVLNASLWFPVLMMGVYLRFWNTSRSYFAFFKLAESVQARGECKAALEREIRWIEAIMPSVVRAEYQTLRQQHDDQRAELWVYNKAYDNVSILFADIVGFTRMSSNKTARMVVKMLNNLFNRFDELCEATKCEKIGTLGDCYYCVAGCPVPRPNHAMCCIEMGLGMCRIIKVFNNDYDESVNMRIGIHTGRVNAAIIGAQRFRFDVYSYDVIIASALESSGKPGRVHISEATFELVKSIYNCALGEPLQIRKEQVRGIAGMELVYTTIATYFVDPRSSQWRVKHERYGQTQNQSTLNDRSDFFHRTYHSSVHFDSSDIRMEARASKALSSNDTLHMDHTQFKSWSDTEEEYDFMQTFERDMRIIYNLETDPEKHYRLFQNLPLQPFLLLFMDRETEWHYHTHICDPTRKTHVDSQKVAPLADLMACVSVHVLTVMHCSSLSPGHQLVSTTYLLVVLSSFIITVCLSMLVAMAATTYEHQLKTKRMRALYRLLTKPLGHELCLMLITVMPSVVCCFFLQSASSKEVLIGKRSVVSMIAFQCLLVHALPLSSASWARACGAFVSFGLLALSHVYLVGDPDETQYCQSMVPNKAGVAYDRYRNLFTMELVLILVLVVLVTRENERNCRLCFYVSREAEIIGEAAEQTMNSARDMLYNIIPKYVMDHLSAQDRDLTVSHRSFNYAVSIPDAAVAFATISNFFSNYYREDYKGGENALKLLNSIICMFDSLVNRAEMKDVEKIKTINDCYMVASGLNRDEVARNESHLTHLVSLMNYCHMMIDALNEFNEMYIIGTEKFEIKIGYNFGPLIAGVIGTVKPMYDIWGNTVNVASRMYSTGIVGKVQVPQDVVTVLNEYFDFVYRGEIFVKGKGDMSTYLCERKPGDTCVL